MTKQPDGRPCCGRCKWFFVPQTGVDLADPIQTQPLCVLKPPASQPWTWQEPATPNPVLAASSLFQPAWRRYVWPPVPWDGFCGEYAERPANWTLNRDDEPQPPAKPAPQAT